MQVFRLLLVSACAAALSACINSTTLIKVKPDGSGVVEQTTLLNMQALKGMMPGMASNGQGNGPMSQASLERTAQRMGPDVRLVSAEPVTANGFEGVKATFAFADINQLQISQDPDVGGNGAMGADRKSNNPVRFALARQGATSVLTVTVQDKPANGGARPPAQQAGMPDMSDPMMMGMMKTLFEGFKVNIGVEVVGTIVRTNAEYVSGPHVTLLEMDMAALLQDEAKFKALQGKLGPDASLSAVKPYLKDIKGIKIDGPVVTVEFK